jgi:hypothetical protein
MESNAARRKTPIGSNRLRGAKLVQSHHHWTVEKVGLFGRAICHQTVVLVA